MLVGHQSDPYPPHDRAEVVTAGASHCDRPHDHQFVQRLGVGELGDGRWRGIAAAKHFGQIHLGDTPGGVLGVVVGLGVDHQAFQHALELDRYLGQQGIHLAGLHERGNVIIGVEAPAGALQPRPDRRRDGLGQVRIVWRGQVAHGDFRGAPCQRRDLHTGLSRPSIGRFQACDDYLSVRFQTPSQSAGGGVCARTLHRCR